MASNLVGEFRLSRGASGSLLGMLTPVVMSMIAQQQEARPLKADRVAGLLAAQKDNIAAGLAPAHVDPMTLWRIVQGECVPLDEAGEGPMPCEGFDLSHGEAEEVAILKDLVGVAQMLAIPTRRITGIEDPQMLAPDAPKVFNSAWGATGLVEARLGKQLPREAIAIAINSQWARTQDQLHLHVDCVAESVADALADYRPALDETWRPMTVPLNGRVYFARRLDSADFADAEPLRLLADGLEEAKARMDAMSLAAVGATFDGQPGFVLLADRFSPEGGGRTEDLQDHDCAIAHSAPRMEPIRCADGSDFGSPEGKQPFAPTLAHSRWSGGSCASSCRKHRKQTSTGNN